MSKTLKPLKHPKEAIIWSRYKISAFAGAAYTIWICISYLQDCWSIKLKMATPLTILGPQTLPSAAGVRRAQPPFGPIHIRPWHSSSLPDLVPIDKYTHTYELKNKVLSCLDFEFSMYHLSLLSISTYKNSPIFLLTRYSQVSDLNGFSLLGWQKGTLHCWQHCWVSM